MGSSSRPSSERPRSDLTPFPCNCFYVIEDFIDDNKVTGFVQGTVPTSVTPTLHIRWESLSVDNKYMLSDVVGETNLLDGSEVSVKSHW